MLVVAVAVVAAVPPPPGPPPEFPWVPFSGTLCTALSRTTVLQSPTAAVVVGGCSQSSPWPDAGGYDVCPPHQQLSQICLVDVASSSSKVVPLESPSGGIAGPQSAVLLTESVLMIVRGCGDWSVPVNVTHMTNEELRAWLAPLTLAQAYDLATGTFLAQFNRSQLLIPPHEADNATSHVYSHRVNASCVGNGTTFYVVGGSVVAVDERLGPDDRMTITPTTAVDVWSFDDVTVRGPVEGERSHHGAAGVVVSDATALPPTTKNDDDEDSHVPARSQLPHSPLILPSAFCMSDSVAPHSEERQGKGVSFSCPATQSMTIANNTRVLLTNRLQATMVSNFLLVLQVGAPPPLEGSRLPNEDVDAPLPQQLASRVTLFDTRGANPKDRSSWPTTNRTVVKQGPNFAMTDPRLLRRGAALNNETLTAAGTPEILLAVAGGLLYAAVSPFSHVWFVEAKSLLSSSAPLVDWRIFLGVGNSVSYGGAPFLVTSITSSVGSNTAQPYLMLFGGIEIFSSGSSSGGSSGSSGANETIVTEVTARIQYNYLHARLPTLSVPAGGVVAIGAPLKLVPFITASSSDAYWRLSCTPHCNGHVAIADVQWTVSDAVVFVPSTACDNVFICYSEESFIADIVGRSLLVRLFTVVTPWTAFKTLGGNGTFAPSTLAPTPTATATHTAPPGSSTAPSSGSSTTTTRLPNTTAPPTTTPDASEGDVSHDVLFWLLVGVAGSLAAVTSALVTLWLCVRCRSRRAVRIQRSLQRWYGERCCCWRRGKGFVVPDSFCRQTQQSMKTVQGDGIDDVAAGTVPLGSGRSAGGLNSSSGMADSAQRRRRHLQGLPKHHRKINFDAASLHSLDYRGNRGPLSGSFSFVRSATSCCHSVFRILWRAIALAAYYVCCLCFCCRKRRFLSKLGASHHWLGHGDEDLPGASSAEGSATSDEDHDEILIINGKSYDVVDYFSNETTSVFLDAATNEPIAPFVEASTALCELVSNRRDRCVVKRVKGDRVTVQSLLANLQGVRSNAGLGPQGPFSYGDADTMFVALDPFNFSSFNGAGVAAVLSVARHPVLAEIFDIMAMDVMHVDGGHARGGGEGGSGSAAPPRLIPRSAGSDLSRNTEDERHRLVADPAYAFLSHRNLATNRRFGLQHRPSGAAVTQSLNVAGAPNGTRPTHHGSAQQQSRPSIIPSFETAPGAAAMDGAAIAAAKRPTGHHPTSSGGIHNAEHTTTGGDSGFLSQVSLHAADEDAGSGGDGALPLLSASAPRAPAELLASHADVTSTGDLRGSFSAPATSSRIATAFFNQPSLPPPAARRATNDHPRTSSIRPATDSQGPTGANSGVTGSRGLTGGGGTGGLTQRGATQVVRCVCVRQRYYDNGNILDWLTHRYPVGEPLVWPPSRTHHEAADAAIRERHGSAVGGRRGSHSSRNGDGNGAREEGHHSDGSSSDSDSTSSALMERNRPSESLLCSVIMQVASFLTSLNQQGLSHGNLKPENILITDTLSDWFWPPAFSRKPSRGPPSGPSKRLGPPALPTAAAVAGDDRWTRKLMATVWKKGGRGGGGAPSGNVDGVTHSSTSIQQPSSAGDGGVDGFKVHLNGGAPSLAANASGGRSALVASGPIGSASSLARLQGQLQRILFKTVLPVVVSDLWLCSQMVTYRCDLNAMAADATVLTALFPAAQQQRTFAGANAPHVGGARTPSLRSATSLPDVALAGSVPHVLPKSQLPFAPTADLPPLHAGVAPPPLPHLGGVSVPGLSSSLNNLPWAAPESMEPQILEIDNDGASSRRHGNYFASPRSPKADVWALGCCIFALATRRVDDLRTHFLFERALEVWAPGGQDDFSPWVIDTLVAAGYSRRFSQLMATLLAPDVDVRLTPVECWMSISVNDEGVYAVR